MFNIVVSDLDGTLLSPEYKITKHTKKTIKLIINLGVQFIIATGRHYIDVIKIFKNLKINSYMITSNGAQIYNNNNILIYSNYLNKKIALELYNITNNDPEILTNIFLKDKWIVNKSYIKNTNLFYKSTFKYKIYKNKKFPIDDICKIYFVSNNYNKLISLEKIFNNRFKNKINVSFSSSICLEVMSKKVSKGNALKKIVNLLGYKLKDCISFGDSMNDKEMLEISGKGCIMKNAHFRLKNSLSNLEIIGSNKNDAISYYLRSIYNLQ